MRASVNKQPIYNVLKVVGPNDNLLSKLPDTAFGRDDFSMLPEKPIPARAISEEFRSAGLEPLILRDPVPSICRTDISVLRSMRFYFAA